jgi:hypothetical protein
MLAEKNYLRKVSVQRLFLFTWFANQIPFESKLAGRVWGGGEGRVFRAITLHSKAPFQRQDGANQIEKVVHLWIKTI